MSESLPHWFTAVVQLFIVVIYLPVNMNHIILCKHRLGKILLDIFTVVECQVFIYIKVADPVILVFVVVEIVVESTSFLIESKLLFSLNHKVLKPFQ